jgi:hypothetical protein
MQPIRSFVVRIYRQDRSGLAGTVEDVRNGRSRAFRSLAELWAALRGRGRHPESDAIAPPPAPPPNDPA